MPGIVFQTLSRLAGLQDLTVLCHDIDPRTCSVPSYLNTYQNQRYEVSVFMPWHAVDALAESSLVKPSLTHDSIHRKNMSDTALFSLYLRAVKVSANSMSTLLPTGGKL